MFPITVMLLPLAMCLLLYLSDFERRFFGRKQHELLPYSIRSVLYHSSTEIQFQLSSFIRLCIVI
jgi:hypothetical protein